MQWVFLIGDDKLSLERFSKMKFTGSEKVSRNAQQLEIVFGEKDYLIFCEAEPMEDSKGDFEKGEYEELLALLPFDEPKWIMLKYKDIGTLKRVIGDESFPEDIIIDCDGVDLGLEEVIDKDRIISTKM